MMKFSVFVILSLLLSITFAVPAKWNEYDELIAMSNDNELQEKRFVVSSWILQKAARSALGAAIRFLCNKTSLPDNMKGVCSCGSMIAGDEEAELEQSKRSFSDVMAYFKRKIKYVCDSKLGKFVGAACQCVRTFI